VLREPLVRTLSAYSYLRRRSEDGHSEHASGELTAEQRKVLSLSTLEWFRSTSNNDMTRSLLRRAFAADTAEQAMADAWLNTGIPLSPDEHDWLIRKAFERINAVYLGVDPPRIIENLFLQGLLPTLPEVQRLNEAERPLTVEPVSFQDLYAILLDTTPLDRRLIEIAKEMFPGYIYDPCVASFESFASVAQRYGLHDADGVYVT
jgi:hypothetical protein